MIIRKTPKDREKYIVVTSFVSNILGMRGFIPKYIDENFVYYTHNDEIIEFMKKEGLKCQNI